MLKNYTRFMFFLIIFDKSSSYYFKANRAHNRGVKTTSILYTIWCRCWHLFSYLYGLICILLLLLWSN